MTQYMNKILFSTVTGAVLLCPFGLTAQDQMTLSVPEISGAAYITGNEINLRKLPSAKSPQLQFQQDAEDYEGSGEAVWSETPTSLGYERRNAKLYKTNVIPVIQASDGWVQTIYSNMTPWVKGDLCRLNPLQQVVPGMSDRYDDRPLSIRTEGAFKDWCAYYWDDEMGGTGIYLGYIVDKIAVLPMMLYCHPAFDENVKGISIAEGEIRYGYDAYIDKGRPAINLDKLSDSDFSKLLSLAEPSQEEQIFYAFDETIFRESIHLDTFTGKLSRMNVERPEVREPQPRVITDPEFSYINPGTKLERVLIQPDGTTLEMSFVNTSGLRQWNVNRYAYIICDATPGKKYNLLRTRGVNISPKPTNISGNRNERISFSMTFEPIPLSSTSLTLVEGSSKDNFHANDVNISERNNAASMSEPQSNGTVMKDVEVAPSFPGGQLAMMEWIGQHIQYPDYAAYKNIQGRVLVKFMVLSDGSIGEIQIAKSIETSLDNEAVRLVKAMPKWNPGTIDGDPVNVWYTVPITFKLN